MAFQDTVQNVNNKIINPIPGIPNPLNSFLPKQGTTVDNGQSVASSGGYWGGRGFTAQTPNISQGAFGNASNAGNLALLSQYRAQNDAYETPEMRAARIGQLMQSRGANQWAQNDTRAQQGQLGSLLYQQAMGGGMSPAQMQMQQGMQNNLASQMAMAGSAAGGNNMGLAQRQLANNLAQTQQDTGYNASILRAQETQAAQQALGGLYGQMRGQDLDAAGMQQQNQQFNTGQMNAGMMQQAGFQQQASMQNQQAELQAQQMKNQMTQYLISQGVDIAEAERQANIEYQKTVSNAFLTTQQTNAGIGSSNSDRNAKMGSSAIGAVGTGIGVLAAMSDVNLKENIKDAGNDIDGFLRALKSESYRYKDKKHGDKPKYVSPMAQDLERTSLGKSMVIDTLDGKMVDYGRGLGVILAAQARIAKRLDKIEGMR